jgi:hypothetical protein
MQARAGSGHIRPRHRANRNPPPPPDHPLGSGHGSGRSTDTKGWPPAAPPGQTSARTVGWGIRTGYFADSRHGSCESHRGSGRTHESGSRGGGTGLNSRWSCARSAGRFSRATGADRPADRRNIHDASGIVSPTQKGLVVRVQGPSSVLSTRAEGRCPEEADRR